MKFSTAVSLVAAVIPGAAAAVESRRLALERLGGYMPRTQVTDQAAIDLDQMKLQEQLALGRLPKAHNVYAEGGHSMSYAEILLLNPQGPHLFHKGDKVIGLTEAEDEVVGSLMDVVDFDDLEGQQIGIKVQYRTSDVQAVYVDCQVGGLFTFQEANREGCFAEDGNLSIFHNGMWYTFGYTYDQRRHNKNARTLQGFSTRAADEMRPCPLMCPYYDDFQKFVDYYGNTNYGDMWVQSAMNFNNTGFANGRGEADFSVVEFKSSIAQAVQMATAYMHVWMYVVKELEESIFECTECTDSECEKDPVGSLDEALAYYVGSLEGEDGTGKGNLIYDLADWTSQSFKTAGEQSIEEHGTSYVNLEIIKQAKSMQESLIDGACNDAKIFKNSIVNLMKVPLIQGTLLYAYKRDHQISQLAEIQEADEAEGATFAASVLPYIHACNADDAEFIHSQLKIGSDSDAVVFADIKKALERNYDCMGVTCTHVGGIWTASGYADGGAPCKDGSKIKSTSSQSANNDDGSTGVSIGTLVFASLFGAMGAVIIAMLYEKRFNKRKAKKQHQHVRNIAAVSEIA